MVEREKLVTQREERVSRYIGKVRTVPGETVIS